jgi:hypothetical protein
LSVGEGEPRGASDVRTQRDRRNSQSTRSFFMAHRAAAARVDTPIFVYTCWM